VSPKAKATLTWCAFAVSLLVVLIEMGSEEILPAPIPIPGTGGKELGYPEGDAVGWGIPFLAFVDGIICYSLLWRSLNYVLPGSIQVKLQVPLALVGGILYILGAIVALFVAFALLLLMMTLLVAVPFGTLVYLARWGGFPSGTASATLGVLMACRVVTLVLLVFADKSALGHKGLLFTLILGFLGGAILSFLHGIAPLPFVAITDMIGALINVILGIVLALVIVIGSIVPLFRVIKGLFKEVKSVGT
jgi:hypothetical protein